MEWLNSISLASLLKLIDSLARYSGLSDCSREVAPKIASEALANWPRGFHLYLARSSESAPVSGSGIWTRFERLHTSLFCNDESKEFEHLRAELIRYGKDHCGNVIVSSSIRGVEKTSEHRFTSIAGISRQTGIARDTIRTWIEKGLIKATLAYDGQLKRYVLDSNAVDKTRRSPKEVMNLRQAAAHIGVSASTLSAIRASGYYSDNPITNKRRGFWKEDLLALEEKLNSIECRRRKLLPDSVMISFGDLMRHTKFGSTHCKRELLEAIFSGDITPVAMRGTTFQDLLFVEDDIRSKKAEVAIQSNQPRLSSDIVAKLIGCDRHVVFALLERGLLERSPIRGQGFLRESIDAFSAKWTPIRIVSRQAGVGWKLLKSIAQLCQVTLLGIQTTHLTTSWFVPNESIGLLRRRLSGPENTRADN